jgi:hypothetical protein
MSGIPLSLLAEEIVILAANNKENLDGAKRIIKSVSQPENSLIGINPEVHLVLSRIPFTDSPKDRLKEQQLLETIKELFGDVYNNEITILHLIGSLKKENI